MNLNKIWLVVVQDKKIGWFSKDKFEGEVYDEWKKWCENEAFELQDVSIYIAYIMARKDDKEIELIQKACDATNVVFKEVYRRDILETIDKEQVKHTIGLGFWDWYCIAYKLSY